MTVPDAAATIVDPVEQGISIPACNFLTPVTGWMRYPYPDEILWQDGTGQPRFPEEVVVVLFFFAVVADADGFVCDGRLLVEPTDVPVSDLDSLADSFTEAISKSF